MAQQLSEETSLPPRGGTCMSEPASRSWVERLQGWAERESNIRVALLVGSQARAETPADRYSDIDLALFVRDPDLLLREEAWISQLGPFWTSHIEPTAVGGAQERRVLFRDGQDVDFAVFPAKSLAGLVRDEHGAETLRRGFRALVNKESVEFSVAGAERAPTPPDSTEFAHLVNDVWFHLIWAAKKLRRGELLVACDATNGYLRALLVRMVRWHALVRGHRQDLWHGSRFFEIWADRRVVEGFAEVQTRYERTSVAASLRAIRTMFCWLADEVGDALGYASPVRDRPGLSAYLDSILDGK
jgi:aminoglycoside 6-adenylyltransferase